MVAVFALSPGPLSISVCVTWEIYKMTHTIKAFYVVIPFGNYITPLPERLFDLAKGLK